MAAALSRALKLPGKKGSELGEYDPLTQADSEDESEEDDLVLNYPRNGLGRGNCLGPGVIEPRGSRTGKLVEEEELEEEEDDDGWRAGRKERGAGLGREGAGLDEEGAEGGAGQVGDPEGRKVRVRGAVRTAAFLLPLACATLVVLLCAFLVPCQQGALQQQAHWETQLGDVGGVTSPPLALWDVDSDGVEDLVIAVTKISNSSVQTSSLGNSKEYSVVALRGGSGELIWRRPVNEAVSSVQCGLHTIPPGVSGAAHGLPVQRETLQPGPAEPHASPVCLLISSTRMAALNASTGKKMWEVHAGEAESQAVAVPDLQGDGVPELLIAALPADQESDLSLVLHSGQSGSLIGQPVNFNLTAQGKLIGPLLHETAAGAYYILFGLGTVEAVSLRDIYRKATGRTAMPLSLSVKDPIWEKQRKTNSSTLIHIYSGPEQAEYLLPLVAGLCNNHNNLDAGSTHNSSHSDWVLVCGSSRVSVLRQRDTHTAWTLNSSAIHSRPVAGHFNDDGVPDLLIQQSANGVRKVQIIDGASGRCLWETEFVCPRLVLEGSSIMTTSGQSVFLFWAGDPLVPLRNITKVNTPEPVLHSVCVCVCVCTGKHT
ncbi:protein FAM234B isoform X2 [Brachyhypopomus gauderio]|uniref:protein FAM234B isoform X2 n=1 Tax=Brachyhypopomus gauderio TaxID=698409 RepID=UPI0040426994